MEIINASFIKTKIVSLLKFAIVGTVGLIIDFSITWFFRNVLLGNSYFASGYGFVVAASSNYYINSKWTFRTNTPATSRQFSLFLIISLIGLGLNIILLYLFQGLSISFYISKALAIAFVLIWNFTANSVITFSSNATRTNDSPSSLSIKPSFIKTNVLNANK